MSAELEKAGLPLSFASTKVTKKTEINRKKKAQKKQQQKKKKQRNRNGVNAHDYRSAESSSDTFNYAEEFKILEVLSEYRNPFTILQPKSERYKSGDSEEEEIYDDENVYQSSCTLDYGFDGDSSVDSTNDLLDTVSDNISTEPVNNLVNTESPSSSGLLDVKLHKYYHQRYDYFSLFDSGIQIDTEGWYSVTPERIAEHIAKEAHSIALTNKSDNDKEEEEEEAKKTIILDAFCGVGGNTIQFAKYFDRVIAVDLDSGRLEMARHNAEIYGVADRIQFIQGDVFKILPELQGEKIDLVFMSPPWGGPNYVSRPVFCPRADILDNRGQELFALGRSISKNLILFLPRQSDIYSLAEMFKESSTRKVKNDDSFVVEQHWLRNRLKAISIYFY